uniref:Uncharacterized protein n=1 Tax=Arundo donax TaxID=35708 RepID=A0A0A8ZI78_ARUDO
MLWCLRAMEMPALRGRVLDAH